MTHFHRSIPTIICLVTIIAWASTAISAKTNASSVGLTQSGNNQDLRYKSRIWKTRNGKNTVKATYLSFDRSNETVRIEKKNGEVLTVPVGNLSTTDRTYVLKILNGTIQPTEAGAAKPEKPGPPKTTARKWTTADKKFSIEAAFESFDGTKVKMRKSNDELVAIDLKKLCQEDQDFVNSLTAGSNDAASSTSESANAEAHIAPLVAIDVSASKPFPKVATKTGFLLPPAPVADPMFEKTMSVAMPIARMESVETLLPSRDKTKILVCKSGSEFMSLVEDNYVGVLDLKKESFSGFQKITEGDAKPADIGPGNKRLMTVDDGFSNQRIDIWQLSGKGSIQHYRAFKVSDFGINEKHAIFINSNVIAVRTRNKGLFFVDIDAGKQIYDVSSTSLPALLPDNQHFVFDTAGGLVVMNGETLEVVRVFPEIKKVQAVTADSSGQFLLTLDKLSNPKDRFLRIWDFASGVLLKDHPVMFGIRGDSLVWPSQDTALICDWQGTITPMDLRSGIPYGQRQIMPGGSTEVIPVGEGKLLMCLNYMKMPSVPGMTKEQVRNSRKDGSFVETLKIPADHEVANGPRTSADEYFSVHPGMSLRIDVDTQFPNDVQSRIVDSITRQIAGKGFTIDPNAALSLSIRTYKRPKPEQIVFKAFGLRERPQQPTRAIVFYPIVNELSYRMNGKALWERTAIAPPGNPPQFAPGTDLDTMQRKLQEHQKPWAEFFESATIPHSIIAKEGHLKLPLMRTIPTTFGQ